MKWLVEFITFGNKGSFVNSPGNGILVSIFVLGNISHIINSLGNLV